MSPCPQGTWLPAVQSQALGLPRGFIIVCLSFSFCKTGTMLLHPWVVLCFTPCPGVEGWSKAAWGQGGGCKTWATATPGLWVQSQVPMLHVGNAASLQQPEKHPHHSGQGRTRASEPGCCHGPGPRSPPASEQSCIGAPGWAGSQRGALGAAADTVSSPLGATEWLVPLQPV